MERREAPGRCATAPSGSLCDQGAARRHEQVCETCPEARASRSGGFARPTIRTLRLPALHRGRVVGGRTCLDDQAPRETPFTNQADTQDRCGFGSGDNFFLGLRREAKSGAARRSASVPRIALRTMRSTME